MANATGGRRMARIMAARAAAAMVLKTNLIAFRVNRAMALKIILGEVEVGEVVMDYSFEFGPLRHISQWVEI
jgi:hypothetical protein